MSTLQGDIINFLRRYFLRIHCDAAVLVNTGLRCLPCTFLVQPPGIASAAHLLQLHETLLSLPCQAVFAHFLSVELWPNNLLQTRKSEK